MKCDEIGGEDKCMRGHLEDTHVGRRLDNTKTDCKEMGWKCVGQIYVAWCRDKLQAVVNGVMNLRIS